MNTYDIEKRLREIDAIIARCEQNGEDYPGALVRESIMLAQAWEQSQRVNHASNSFFNPQPIACHDPDEQLFVLNNKVIGIDWGRNGDKPVQVTSIIEPNGTVTIEDIKVIGTGKTK